MAPREDGQIVVPRREPLDEQTVSGLAELLAVHGRDIRPRATKRRSPEKHRRPVPFGCRTIRTSRRAGGPPPADRTNTRSYGPTNPTPGDHVNVPVSGSRREPMGSGLRRSPTRRYPVYVSPACDPSASSNRSSSSPRTTARPVRPTSTLRHGVSASQPRRPVTGDVSSATCARSRTDTAMAAVVVVATLAPAALATRK